MGPCPNGTCPHVSGVHDIYEMGDPYPTCCMEGCECGHPQEVTLRVDTTTGHRSVVGYVPYVIRVAAESLPQMVAEAWDGETLTLDSGGICRYQLLRRDPRDDRMLIFGRIKSGMVSA
jgi:hypothetical protein